MQTLDIFKCPNIVFGRTACHQTGCSHLANQSMGRLFLFLLLLGLLHALLEKSISSVASATSEERAHEAHKEKTTTGACCLRQGDNAMTHLRMMRLAVRLQCASSDRRNVATIFPMPTRDFCSPHTCRTARML